METGKASNSDQLPQELDPRNWPPYETVLRLRSARVLRAALLSIAVKIAKRPAETGLLILVDPHMTESRIRREVEDAKLALHDWISRGLNLVLVFGTRVEGVASTQTESFLNWLSTATGANDKRRMSVRSRPPSHFVVLQILILNWMKAAGAVSRMEIGRIAGYSYPTVAKALTAIDDQILPRSDKRVELREFPRAVWSRMVATNETLRKPVRFRDVSDSPRSPEALLERLARFPRADLAVGGVLGARHYYPDFDLVGTPRLDLSMHCPSGEPDLSFIRSLDPALQESEKKSEPAHVVIHLIRRAKALFEPSNGPIPWADPVECLLDLHEMRLESQAAEFVHYFESNRAEQ